MGMRIADDAARATAPMLWIAAAALAAETVGLCVAVIFNAVDSASGNSWTTSNAIAFIVMEVIVATGVAFLASGVARVRPWSRTPALMTQLLAAAIAIWLLEAHRYAWGFPPCCWPPRALPGCSPRPACAP